MCDHCKKEAIFRCHSCQKSNNTFCKKHKDRHEEKTKHTCAKMYDCFDKISKIFETNLDCKNFAYHYCSECNINMCTSCEKSTIQIYLMKI